MSAVVFSFWADFCGRNLQSIMGLITDPPGDYDPLKEFFLEHILRVLTLQKRILGSSFYRKSLENLFSRRPFAVLLVIENHCEDI